ncbi:MAG: septal ring lytic transglycosylase RlpA family protein [Gammaproteobacteria bacterium]|nr:septal ring lytic transglycosylase RlpA family protein [Gammaproteobacteria bacterium]
MIEYLKFVLISSLIIVFSGCGRLSIEVVDKSPNSRQYPYDEDGIDHSSDIDPMSIKSAVPKYEPKSQYGNPRSYEVFGKTYYVLDAAQGFSQTGIASWYGKKFHGERTSSGEDYDMFAMSAAHKTLPLPTYVKVTNLSNRRSVIVKVNDRGPFHTGRIIDLSYAAAYQLDIVKTGTAKVKIEAIVVNKHSATKKVRVIKKNQTVYTKQPFYVQAGAFTSIDNAKSLQRALLAEYTYPIKIKYLKSNGKLFKRVWIGPIYNRDAAEKILNRVLDKHSSTARLILDENK